MVKFNVVPIDPQPKPKLEPPLSFTVLRQDQYAMTRCGRRAASELRDLLTQANFRRALTRELGIEDLSPLP